MIPAPIPADDEKRVASLARMTLLSTPRESDLDRITLTDRKVFGTEIALISLVDKERQWFKSCIGIGIDATGTPRLTQSYTTTAAPRRTSHRLPPVAGASNTAPQRTRGRVDPPSDRACPPARSNRPPDCKRIYLSEMRSRDRSHAGVHLRPKRDDRPHGGTA